MRAVSIVIFFITPLIIISSCKIKEAKNEPLKMVTRPTSAEVNKYDSTVFEEAYKKLKNNTGLSTDEIRMFSNTAELRHEFYTLLAEFDRADLFPKEYYNFEKAAEGDLVNWLEYPTELDTVPSKIELMKKVDLLVNDTSFSYYVFQFRTDDPHWAAKDGWMVGVSGPYLKNSKPYDWVSGTFSRFSKAKETTPETEAKWAHENIYSRSPE